MRERVHRRSRSSSRAYRAWCDDAVVHGAGMYLRLTVVDGDDRPWVEFLSASPHGAGGRPAPARPCVPSRRRCERGHRCLRRRRSGV